MAKALKIAVDMGNSRIKVLADHHYFAYQYTDIWLSKLGDYFSTIPKHSRIAISSVNPKMESYFLKLLESLEIKNVYMAQDLLEKQELIDFSKIQGMGSDRRLGLLGALSIQEPPFITIDCGTACTVNIVDVNKKCLGGAIFPGMYTQIRSLAERAAKLDYIEMKYQLQAAGRNTSDAIRSGILSAVSGGLILLIQKSAEQEFNGQIPPIYMTGGYSELIANLIKDRKYNPIVEKKLVLLGLSSLLKTIKSDNPK